MIDRIISGGQTGVDQAALDVALELSIPCGGWCPAGRGSEAGPIDARYPLTETDSADPARRTALNVRETDGTLIIADRPLSGGTALTQRCADQLARPCLLVDPDDDAAPQRIGRWLAEYDIHVLNVAGLSLNV